jgi:hypothetical protein
MTESKCPDNSSLQFVILPGLVDQAHNLGFSSHHVIAVIFHRLFRLVFSKLFHVKADGNASTICQLDTQQFAIYNQHIVSVNCVVEMYLNAKASKSFSVDCGLLGCNAV